MKKFIVADGGGTKTEYLLFTEDGQVLAHAKSGGTNATFIGAKMAAERVNGGICECLKKAKLTSGDISRVHLFIPGFLPAMELLQGLDCKTELMDDFWNAYYGALASPTGIVALAGTGSFIAGRKDNSPLAIVGGWGPLFGDEGSGYRLGVLCLQAVSKEFDSGLPESIMTKLLLKSMNLKNVEELRLAAYEKDFTREKIAELSYLVEQAAQMGDTVAAALFDTLALELCEQVQRLAKRIDAQEGLKLSVTGGMCKTAWFLNAFEKASAKMLPSLCFSRAKYSPLIGGALYLLAEKEKLDITNGIAEEIYNRLNEKEV